MLLASLSDDEVAELELLVRSELLEAARVAAEAAPPVLDLQPKQRLAEDLSARADEILMGGAAGGGKMVRVDEPVPIPAGWTTIGALRPGDTIFDDKGEWTTVLAVHPVDPEPEAYRLTFDDGSTVEACADHLWLTYDAVELSALTRRDPAWRAARRERRPSRATGRRDAKFTETLTARNRIVTPATTPAPTGTVRATKDIAATLLTPAGRTNHAVPVACALNMPHAELPIDPYLLGAWLGDGDSVGNGFTCADEEILDEFRRAGVAVGAVNGSRPYRYRLGVTVTAARANGRPGRVSTWAAALRDLGVAGDKFIPWRYLRASPEQRLALLQGLMDTDGTVTPTGRVTFCTTSARLAGGVHELIVSLGWKVRLREARAKLNGRVIGPMWVFSWTPDRQVFRLSRKADRQRPALARLPRRTTRFRYVVACDRVAPTPMRCITVDSPSRLYLLGPHMIPTHNTFWLIDHARRQMELYPGNRGVIFRREMPSLYETVIPRALAVFAGRAVWNDQRHTFTFRNGSVLRMASLPHKQSVYKWSGAELGFIGYEELTEFLEEQIDFMLSRLRAPVGGVHPHMAATTNPGGIGHRWVKRRYVKPKTEDWLPEGVDAASDEAERLRPTSFKPWVAVPTDDRPKPLVRVFVPSTMDDNPALIARDPDYPAKIQAIANRGLRKALETGDWDAIDAVEGALVLQSWLDAGRVHPSITPQSVRRGVACDPADGTALGDEFGITGGFLAEDGRCYIDLSIGLRLMTPRAMAQRAINLYWETRADVLIVEKNHGGAWLRQVFLDVDPDVNVEITWASDGKRTRAEPALALFEPPDEKFLTRGGRLKTMARVRRDGLTPPFGDVPQYARARLAGQFEELEGQMTSWTGAAGEESPDRLDSLVWLLNVLASLSRTQTVTGQYDDVRFSGRRSR